MAARARRCRGDEGAPFWPLPILLKRVEGVAGDRFCWHDGRHWINDRPMPELDPLAFELERRRPAHDLARMPSSCRG